MELAKHFFQVAAGFAFQDATGLIYAISVPAPAAHFANTCVGIEQTLHNARIKLLDGRGSTWLV